MKNEEIIEKTRSFVEDKFKNESTGHDYWHMYRVWRLAINIASREPQANMFVVEIAALLHDIADYKFHSGDETIGPKEAKRWLESLDVSNEVIEQVEYIIKNISFRGAKVKQKLETIESKIVYDADKLDSIGAIGISRVFAYGGKKGRPIYDPDIKAELHNSFDAYKNNEGTSINHFYEKLLLLKDLMHTKLGKEIAQSRHKIMEDFLNEFFNEWEGIN